MDIDDLKSGLSELADEIEEVQNRLTGYDNMNLGEVADRLDEAEAAISNITGDSGRGTWASDRVRRLAEVNQELQDEVEQAEARAEEFEARVRELEERIEELG
jgi:methyl-accepting chemotaxis protein